MPITNNIRFEYPNLGFCEVENAFYNFDHINKRILKKDSSGIIQATYPVTTSLSNADISVPIIAQKVSGYRFEFTTNKSNAHFWTLEKLTSGIKVRRFNLNNGIARFARTRTIEFGNLIDEWSLSNDANNAYDVNALSVECKNTSLVFDVLPGASSIFLEDVDTLIQGARIVLGPSSNVNNAGQVEELVVSSFNSSTGQVFLESPVQYRYNSLDEVVYHTKILLFNNNAPGPRIGDGSLTILSATTGRVLSTVTGGQYVNVRSAVYSNNEERTLYLRGNQILHLNSQTLSYSKSNVINNVFEQNVGAIPVYDLAISTTLLYRLQTQSLDSSNVLSSFSGPGIYNYVTTNILPVPTTATVIPQRQVLFGDDFDKTYIDVLVKDQYGNVVSNTQVRIRAVGDEAGIFLSFGTGQDLTSPTDKLTNDYGQVKFYYKAGNNVNTDTRHSEVQLIVTLVSTSKEFSSFLIQRRYTKVSGYFSQKIGITKSNYLLQKSIRTSQGIIQRHYKKVGFPALSSTSSLGTALNNYRDSYDGFKDIDWDFWATSYANAGFQGSSPITTVAQLGLWQLRPTKTASFYIVQKTNQKTGSLIQDIRVKTNSSILQQVRDIQSVATLFQVNLIDEIIPTPFSEKNSIDTNIFIRLNDPGFPINVSTIRLYINGADVTSQSSIGEDSLPGQTEILYNPPTDFTFSERVYVLLTFYDTASGTPNFYDIEYYFDVTPDFRAPVLVPIFPSKGEVGVPITSTVSFNLIDFDNDVDPESIRLYIDNILCMPLNLSRISNGYTVSFTPVREFFYGQDVSVCVLSSDVVGNGMISTFRFYTESGHPPIITEITPHNCAKLVHRDAPTIFEIYSDGDGVDLNTIRVIIDGKSRRFLTSPSIRRLT